MSNGTSSLTILTGYGEHAEFWGAEAIRLGFGLTV